MKIRHYRNTIHLNSHQCSELFGGESMKTAHHYNLWLKTISFLKRRGFKVTENETYKQHYACLSKFHKIGHKGNVSCLFEITGRSIIIMFGDNKNLWTGHSQNFWDDPNDKRYTQLTYLERVAVALEKLRLIDFYKTFGFELEVEDYDLLPADFIIQKLRSNTHIHGKVTCLEDIKASITPDSHNYKQNSNDKNNKKIICGDRKYYYDYKGNLHTGIVWHNINNMWWSIEGDILRNVAAFELFDFTPGTTRRRPASKERINKLLKEVAAEGQYLRAHNIQKYFDLLFNLKSLSV